LQGNGYFALQTPLGVRYSRNGRFQLDPTGKVVNAQGYALLDGTQPLTLPTDPKDLTITKEGAVTTSQGQAGQIQPVQFADERALTPVAGGLYVTDATPSPAKDTTVQQGMVEESNVESIVEMTRMLTISRNF